MRRGLLTRSILSLALASLSVLGGNMAQAQNTSTTPDPLPVSTRPIESVDVDPALWVIKDKDTTVYLFGTIHVLKPGLSWFDEAVKSAFDGSNELVIELIDPPADQSQQIFTKYALDTSGKTLRDKLPAKERGNLEAALKKIGFPEDAFDPLDPWAAAVTIQVLAAGKNGYDPNQGVDKQLSAAAKAAGKKISAVETFEGQIKIFDGLRESEQLRFLNETTADLDGLTKGLDALVEAWSNGEEQKLGDLMNEGLTSAELKSALLTRRNAAWAVWVNERMKRPGTVFMAVGAGHLSGSVSLQNMLSAYGIRTKRVDY